MYGRAGLDRFKKAESVEPFSVTNSNTSSSSSVPPPKQAAAASQVGVVGVGQGLSTWQPPDWAIEPRPGVYCLDVMKDGQVVDQIQLHKRRHIFGRQIPTCDFVLDHQSVSRQHAAVVPHKNGSVYVIDLGSVHGTFVANERLSKDTPVELEVGQSLRFAASTRSYILRKNNAAPPSLSQLNLPPPPDPSDHEAVLAYNTILNRHAIPSSLQLSPHRERPTKRLKKARVSFTDQFGGELVQVVGISDGADVSTEPGPLGVKEGSLVGKYGSLVQTTIIPKGKETSSTREDRVSPKGVTHKLQQVFNKVKAAPKTTGIYDDLYGEALPTKLGSSWAQANVQLDLTKDTVQKPPLPSSDPTLGYDNDDLFGDSLD